MIWASTRAGRRLRQSTAWLAACAVLLHALWPLAAAANARTAALQPDICSVAGVHLPRSGDAPLRAPVDAGGLSCLHCGLCASRLADNAVPASRIEFDLSADDRAIRPRRADARAAKSAVHLLRARPRAPPAFFPL